MRERSNDHVTIRINTRTMDTSILDHKNDFPDSPQSLETSEEISRPKQSLLEQARERSTLFQSQKPRATGQADIKQADLSQSDIKQANIKQANIKQADIRQVDIKQADIQPENSRADSSEEVEQFWRRKLTYNTQGLDVSYRTKRKFGMTEKTRKGMVAGLFGICAGLLLGIGAYFLFTSATGISKMSSLNANSENTNQAAKAASAAAQNESATAAASSQSANALGPGGATGPGTTVYLYQLGMYSDANSADQVIQQLKGKGLNVMKRGDSPYQLIAGAAATKSGFSDFNQFLQDQTVGYYMKPFVVPEIPASIPQVSSSTAQQLQKSLQEEWNAVEQFNQGGEVSLESNVQKDVQQSLGQLPQSQNVAKTALAASLQDLKDLANVIAANTNSADPNQTAKQSYLLAKFYIDFAQGVADLS